VDQDIRLVYAAASNQRYVSFFAELLWEDRKPPKDLVPTIRIKMLGRRRAASCL
jgi:hypothetical protein